MSVQIQAAALAEAARTAGYAPSIHNTQPWRWRVRGPALELFAVRKRQLAITDPLGRMLMVSCGAALHQARLTLAAEGWTVKVERLPKGPDPDLLARVTVTGRGGVTAEAMRLLQTARIRRTDRRPVSAAPVDPAIMERLRETADAEGAHLHVLRSGDVIELASAASHAQHVEDLDPEWTEEMVYWAGGGHGEGLGIPDEAIPSSPPETTVPGRDFGRGGTLPVGHDHDRAAVYAILYTDEDSPANWLRVGEALSAVWLDAIEHHLSVLPLSAVVEVAETRQTLRRMLAGVGEPCLALRFGVADPDHAGALHTPRLPAEQTVEILEP
jgi:hypothetical protein